MRPTLRLGTRSSALALKQAEIVAALLRHQRVDVSVVPSSSAGDHDTHPLPGRSKEGIFVSSLRDQLNAGEVDFLVHSYKDIPVQEADGLTIGSVARRADPRDVLVSPRGDITTLPDGARVGTCSVRRAAWVQRTMPGAQVMPIRGPIDARVQQLRDHRFDAIILAAAGLCRLGLSTLPRFGIAAHDLVPAPAQGALALECRSGDRRVLELIRSIHHLPTSAAVEVEREVLRHVDPDESAAVGVLCLLRSDRAYLLADHASPNGHHRTVVHRHVTLEPSVPIHRQLRTLTLSVIEELRACPTWMAA